MPVEFLPESAPWPIELPAEPDRGRVLEATKRGRVVQRWLYEYDAWWVDYMVPCSWASIVFEAIRDGWTLTSLPPETGEAT